MRLHGVASPNVLNNTQSKFPRINLAQRRSSSLDYCLVKPRNVAVASTTAVDVVSTASDLIQSASVQGSLPAHGVTDFIQALHNVLDSGNIYEAASKFTTSGLDASHAFTAALPADALAVEPDMLSAAHQGLSDLASFAPGWGEAASSAAALLAGDQGSSLQALSALAHQRLAVLQSIDPMSYQTMQSSMGTLFDSLQGLLSHEMGTDAVQWTNALVLAVQQLVTATKLDEAGGLYSIDAMAEAQKAMQAQLKAGGPELNGLIAICMGAVALIVASIPRDPEQLVRAAAVADDKVPLRYSPAELSAYWSKRPLQVVQRSVEVASKLMGFLVVIIGDAQTGQWEKKMPQRAVEIRKIVESLGATCVKIAQAASTRVDMLPQAYLDEFTRLQDNVKTFSTMEARYVLEEGLNRPVDTIFEWLSEEPLAAASLGQVYRGKLLAQHGGNEVAVKVQRPGVLESAALDVFIMRRGAVLFSKLPGMSDQWACVLDDWALRFFQEMDYQLEASNTMTFKKQMASLEGIMVPTVHPDLTSRKVIVTDWIEAERFGECSPSDIKAMCSTLLNCYLIQLLETGLLHADPHPGNLMRTYDGKLVILDFGLMTEVTEAQRIGLVEFIAHLTMEDWDALTEDLVTLGFMPPNMPDEARKLIKPVMNSVFSKIVSGGGLGKAGLNFASLGVQLSHISMSYQLCIPGYFTNVIRAFSVIEGQALKVDPSYGIVQECSPYLSRRLLTDNNPRMRAALRQLLYGDGQRLDVARLQQLVSSFSAFTTSAAPARSAEGVTLSQAYEERVKGAAAAYRPESPVLNPTMREALKVVFAKDGSYAQELIVEELVAATDAMSREALSEALRLIMGSAAAVSALRSTEALGPLRAMLMPIPLPMEVLRSMQPVVALSSEDRQALNTLHAILDLMQVSMVQGIPNVAQTTNQAVRAAGEVMPMLPELLPGMQATLNLFIKQLVRRMALRLAEDLGPMGSAAPAAGVALAGQQPAGSATAKRVPK